MPRPIHFDIPADDPERAARFYTEALGWQIAKWDGPMDYWMVVTGPSDTPGINGGIGRRQQPGGGMNTMEVDDLTGYVAKVRKAGGKVVHEKMAIPGVGWMAVCADTEGNRFGLLQPDESAK